MRAFSRDTHRETGFTLVELLVAVVLFGVIATVLFSTVVSTSSAVTVGKTNISINEEARLTFNRISREVREARGVAAVGFSSCGAAPLPACVAPYTGSMPTSLTLEVDFNGNGVVDSSLSDPEILTYCWDPAANRILLTPALPSSNDCDDPGALPVLTSDVESFALDFFSSRWQYDANGDGATSWQELDAAPLSAGVGNRNGVLDALELKNVDRVSISMTVFKGPRRQAYRTSINVRNRA